MIEPATDMPRESPEPFRRLQVAAGIAALTLALVWAWWAVEEGAYFGDVYLPGLIVLCLFLALISSSRIWPRRPALNAWATWALVGMGGLAAWSALSALWSSTPDVAVADAQRIAGYAVMFGLGLWIRALGGVAWLVLAPLSLAALVAGAVTVGGLLTGSDLQTFADEGTLRFPLGYRNANAAFFLIAFWPTIYLAADRKLNWLLRGVAAGTATMCLELAILSQSRASTIAFAVAVVVFLIVSPNRARLLGWIALVTVAALAVIPSVGDLHATADLADYTGTAELRLAGRYALLGALLSLVLGTAVASAGTRTRERPELAGRMDRGVAIGAIGMALAAVVAFVVATGDPVHWIDDRVDEFLTQGTPKSEGGSRFGLNAGSERDDLWRVALDALGERPLAGLGAGGFEYFYPSNRSEEGLESVKDAHSVELEVGSELGLVGLVLFGLTVVAAIGGAWRGRVGSAAGATISACALTVAAYWLAHSSIDWFWMYPGVTAPVFALLGAACASGGEQRDEPATWRRKLIVLGASVLALSAVPPFLSERYLDSAYNGWRSDSQRAADDLDRAKALNPLAIEPYLAEGAIARAAGDDEAAITAFSQAVEKREDDWAAQYFLAQSLAPDDPAAAEEPARRVLELNPLSPQVRRLVRRILGPEALDASGQ